MSAEEALAILETQKLVSATLLSELPSTFDPALKDSAPYKGEIHGQFPSGKVLHWVVTAPGSAAGGDILEIGAAMGVGSTKVLAEALLQANSQAVTSNSSRQLLSIEAVPERYATGRLVAQGHSWPANTLLATTVPADAMPTTVPVSHSHGSPDRLRANLVNEREVAARHKVGVLGALCRTRRFGVIFIDGGSFTGDAEWAIVQSHCGHVRWVALDDTNAKTKGILIAARAQPERWEVVYEESQGKTGKKAVQTGRAYGPFAKELLEAIAPATTSAKLGYRNFALLRSLTEPDNAPP